MNVFVTSRYGHRLLAAQRVVNDCTPNEVVFRVSDAECIVMAGEGERSYGAVTDDGRCLADMSLWGLQEFLNT